MEYNAILVLYAGNDLCQFTIIICISYNVLMIYCVYIIVIHDCMYVRNIVAIIVWISYVIFFYVCEYEWWWF